MNRSIENESSDRMHNVVSFAEGSDVFIYSPDQRVCSSKWYSMKECRGCALDAIFEAKRVKDLCANDHFNDVMKAGYISPEDILGIEYLLSITPQQAIKECRGHIKACVMEHHRLLTEGETMHGGFILKLGDYASKSSVESVENAKARAARILPKA